jgi:hypothetical protein
VHLRFQLSATLPCPNGQSSNPVHIPFGGKASLVGFFDHRGRFVPVHNGRIERFNP